MMREAAVTLSMACHVGLALLPDGQRRRSPDLAGVLVPDIQNLARRVTHRIVRPRGELILAAVHRPGKARAGLRDLEAERRIRDDVDPRRRGAAPTVED